MDKEAKKLQKWIDGYDKRREMLRMHMSPDDLHVVVPQFPGGGGPLPGKGDK